MRLKKTEKPKVKLSFHYFLFLLVFYAPSGVLRADDLGPGDYDDARLTKTQNAGRRENLLSWHDGLVDRFNRFLNRAKAFSESPYGAGVGKLPISKEGFKKLEHVQATLDGNALCGTLATLAPREDRLEGIAQELDAAEGDLKDVEEAWLKANNTQAELADQQLDQVCQAQSLQSAHPVNEKQVRYYSELLAWCETGPHNVFLKKRIKHCFADGKKQLVHAQSFEGDDGEPSFVPPAQPKLMQKPVKAKQEPSQGGDGLAAGKSAKANKNGAAGKVPALASKDDGAAAEEIKESDAKGEQNKEVDATASAPPLTAQQLAEIQAHLAQPTPELLAKLEQADSKDPKADAKSKEAQKKVEQVLREDARYANAKPMSEGERIAFAQNEYNRAVNGDTSDADLMPFLLSVEKTDSKSADLNNIAYGTLLKAADQKFAEYSAVANQNYATPRARRNAIAHRMNADFTQDYTKVLARLADFLRGKGGDCDAETRMMISFYQHAKVPLGADEVLGVQLFGDHIQPVIWNKKKNTVENMISGKVLNGVVAPIYKPAMLPQAYLGAIGKDGNAPVDKLLLAAPDAKLLALAEKEQKGKAIDKISTNSTLKYPPSPVRASLGSIPDKATIGYSDSDEPESAEVFLKQRQSHSLPNAGEAAKNDGSHFKSRHLAGISLSTWKAVEHCDRLNGYGTCGAAIPKLTQLIMDKVGGSASTTYGPPTHDFEQIADKIETILKSQGLKDALRFYQDPVLWGDDKNMSDAQLKGIAQTMDLLADVLDADKNRIPTTNKDEQEFGDIMHFVPQIPELRELTEMQQGMLGKVVQNPADFLQLWERLPKDRKRLIGEINRHRFTTYPGKPGSATGKDSTDINYSIVDGSWPDSAAALILAAQNQLDFRKELSKPRAGKVAGFQGQEAMADDPSEKDPEKYGAEPASPQNQTPAEGQQSIQGADKALNARAGNGLNPRSKNSSAQNKAPVLVDAQSYAGFLLSIRGGLYIQSQMSTADKTKLENLWRKLLDAAPMDQHFVWSEDLVESLLAKKEIDHDLATVILLRPDLVLSNYWPSKGRILTFTYLQENGEHADYSINPGVVKLFIRLLKDKTLLLGLDPEVNVFAHRYGSTDKAIQALESLLK